MTQPVGMTSLVTQVTGSDRVKGYCTYSAKIKLPLSLRGKKKQFTVKSAASGATTATTYKKTLKLK